MPIVPAAFAAELLKHTDENDPAFAGFPETANEVADVWMSALRALFVAPMTSPVGASGSASAQAMGSAAMAPLVPIPPPLSATPPPALAALQAGFLGFGVAFALENPVSVPPPAPFVPPGFAPTTDPIGPANALASAAALWAATGMWTPGPPVPPVPWS